MANPLSFCLYGSVSFMILSVRNQSPIIPTHIKIFLSLLWFVYKNRT